MILILTFSSESQKEKFEYIYQSYKRLLLHKSYGILKDWGLAEDAVSEAFIRIYKNLDKIPDPASKSCIAFIVTITRNISLTMLAREQKQNYLPLADELPGSGNLEHYILGEITAAEIIRVVDTLKSDLKDVFLLSYAHQLSHREIARLLQISENNVTVRLYRAKKALAKLLIQEGYVYEEA